MWLTVIDYLNGVHIYHSKEWTANTRTKVYRNFMQSKDHWENDCHFIVTAYKPKQVEL